MQNSDRGSGVVQGTEALESTRVRVEADSNSLMEISRIGCGAHYDAKNPLPGM